MLVLLATLISSKFMGFPEKIKNDTKFKVCNHRELIKKGWLQPAPKVLMCSYEHEDYCGVITYNMINENQGKVLTIKEHRFQNWYSVKENDYIWPVAVFLENLGHICTEGMTPIDGWFICKNCGDNLREVK